MIARVHRLGLRHAQRNGYSMQAFNSPFVCPYYTCTSPYCLTGRNSIVSPGLVPNRSRGPPSPTQPSSFSISSILSGKADDQAKASREPFAVATTAETTLGFSRCHSSHVSVDRFHPYHRILGGEGAFSRMPQTQAGQHKGMSN